MKRWPTVLLSIGISLILGEGCSADPASPPPPITKIIITNTTSDSSAIEQDHTSRSSSAETASPTRSPSVPAPKTASSSSPSSTASKPTASTKQKEEKAIAVIPPQTPQLSPGVAEIAQMAQSGVSEQILLKYIEHSNLTYHLTAEEIVYLKDIGVPDSVISAMIDRSGPVEMGQTESAQASSQSAQQATASSSNLPAQESSSTSQTPSAQEQTEPAPPVYAQSVAAPNAPPPPPTGTVTEEMNQSATTIVNNYFYAPLAPYGSWIYLDDLGWCWRPTVAVLVPGWRPYVHGGRWIYTDCGWYWYSYYSWGWATFHYGRWYLSPTFGWVWVPGSVWAPAWVVWRYTDGYCGWAPLPPGTHWSFSFGLTYYDEPVSISFGFGLGPSWFTFVDYDHFLVPDVYDYCLVGDQVNIIYNNTVVINNYTQQNNTVINNGIPLTELPDPVRTRIPRYKVKPMKYWEQSTPMPRPEKIDPVKRYLAVYRPNVPQDLKIPRDSKASNIQPPYLPTIRKAAYQTTPPRTLSPLVAQSQNDSHPIAHRSLRITPSRRPTVTRPDSPTKETSLRRLSSSPTRSISRSVTQSSRAPLPRYPVSKSKIVPKQSSPSSKTLTKIPKQSIAPTRRLDTRTVPSRPTLSIPSRKLSPATKSPQPTTSSSSRPTPSPSQPSRTVRRTTPTPSRIPRRPISNTPSIPPKSVTPTRQLPQPSRYATPYSGSVGRTLVGPRRSLPSQPSSGTRLPIPQSLPQNSIRSPSRPSVPTRSPRPSVPSVPSIPAQSSKALPSRSIPRPSVSIRSPTPSRFIFPTRPHVPSHYTPHYTLPHRPTLPSSFRTLPTRPSLPHLPSRPHTQSLPYPPSHKS